MYCTPVLINQRKVISKCSFYRFYVYKIYARALILLQEVHFAVGPFTITSLRETVIDFTKAYMEDGGGIITKRPEEEKDKILKVFKPFQPMVWAGIGAALGTTAILFFTTCQFSPYERIKIGPDTTYAHNFGFFKSIWVVYGSYVEQGNAIVH